MLHNCEGQPATFAGARGESNIDLTLSTRGVAVNDWSVLEGFNHRLIVYRVDGVVRSATCAEPMEEPVRFRDRGVDWDVFERTVQMRVGRIRWAPPCEENRKLEGGDRELDARLVYLRARAAYRRRMREIQTAYFRQIAESGNVDPWVLPIRAASRRCRAPNVVVNLALSEASRRTRQVLCQNARALCPDDCPAGDSGYHRLVRVAAILVPSGRCGALETSTASFRTIDFHRAKRYPGGVEGLLPNTWLILFDISGARQCVVAHDLTKVKRGEPWELCLGPALLERAVGRLAAAFPAGVKTVAYADDVTVLVEASSRAEIERSASLDLMQDWGRRNRLATP
ncbi:hypothetical protein EVAR_89965_1 [Eumeta japonica]|uniref:Reverse transcriptase domain-containing protein n=1 Tax=Eumeta variegata TaxID=151549 RepID=A0A4C2AA38_EUMVA|nr:hypothetical protein EVAR_89965_1 [Eumeta japonica]